jgi:hypothetical protein
MAGHPGPVREAQSISAPLETARRSAPWHAVGLGKAKKAGGSRPPASVVRA